MAAASVSARDSAELPVQDVAVESSDNSDAESEEMEADEEEEQQQQQQSATGDQAGNEQAEDPLIEPCAFESEIYTKLKEYPVVSQIPSEEKQIEIMKYMLSTQKEKENKPRGIQSLYNSSSSDCTLYCMFAFNTSFDYLFKMNVPCESNSPMRILSRQIVVPLRKIGFVGAKRTVALKLALQRVGGLRTKAIVDVRKPGRFMDDLLNKGLRVEPQLQAIPVPGPVPTDELTKPKPLNSLSVNVKFDCNQDYITSQRLVEQWTLEKKMKLEKPRNLVLDLKRNTGQFEEPSVVLPMIEIGLIDCLHGVKRECSVCPSQNEKKPAAFECKECFDINDDKHRSLCMCTYCEECFETYHKDAEDRKGHKAIRVSPARAANQAANDGVSKQDSSGRINYPYELYAVVCQNVTGYVAYARTDVEEQLIKDIKDYIAPIERLELFDADADAPAAAAAASEGDDTTKQKQPEAAASTSAGANDMPSNVGQSSSSDSAGAESQTGQDKAPSLWVYYDPENIVKEDVRGGYNVPQVFAVENFASLIDYTTLDKSYGLVDPLVENINKQHQYRLMCESVALFYRPIPAKK